MERVSISVHREPIKVQRRPVTVLTDNGYKMGGWYAFHKPAGEEPPQWELGKGERILWCPYCGDWSIFSKDYSPDSSAVWRCRGVCGWANTNDYHVRDKNSIWWEGVPLSEIRKLEIPKPTGRR